MLKLIEWAKTATPASVANLNTSHVKVNLLLKFQMLYQNQYLNTSHVKVNQI